MDVEDHDIVEFPKGLQGSFEVEGYVGDVGSKNWTLKDQATGRLYSLTANTVAGWDLPTLPSTERFGPKIIVSMGPKSMVVMALGTGSFYTTNPPPSGLARRKKR
ncbi:DUF5440 family protein [Pseudomonas aeruginosa]